MIIRSTFWVITLCLFISSHLYAAADCRSFYTSTDISIRPFAVDTKGIKVRLLNTILDHYPLATDYNVIKNRVDALFGDLCKVIPEAQMSSTMKSWLRAFDALETQKTQEGHLYGAPNEAHANLRALVVGEIVRSILKDAGNLKITSTNPSLNLAYLPNIQYQLLSMVLALTKGGSKMWNLDIRNMPGASRYFETDEAKRDSWYDFKLLQEGPDQVRVAVIENEMAALPLTFSKSMEKYRVLDMTLKNTIESSLGALAPKNVIYLPKSQLEITESMGVFLSSLINPIFMRRRGEPNPLEFLQDEIPRLLGHFTTMDKAGLVNELLSFASAPSRSTGKPLEDENRVRRIAKALAEKLVAMPGEVPWHAFEFILK